jgi:integrase
MASIHKDPKKRSPFWYCAYTLPDGTRAFKSTKQKNKSVATEVCAKLARAARNARTKNFGEAQARKLLNEILEASGQSPMNLQTVEEFANSWLAGKKLAKAAGTARRYSDVLMPFLQSLGPRRKINLTALGVDDVQSFIRGGHNDGLSNASLNFRLKTIRSMLTAARRQGLLTINVAEAIDALPDASAEKGTFKPEEIDALLNTANREWQGVILLGVSAGLRLSDAAQLLWENVDLHEGNIHYHPKKTSRKPIRPKEERVPMLPDVRRYFQALLNAGVAPKGFIFPVLATKKAEGRGGLSNTFSRLISQAGISNGILIKAGGDKGRNVYRLSHHSVKHTFITNMMNLGVPKELRMKIVGHTSNAHDRYTHIDAETCAKALKEYPSFLKQSHLR